MQKNKIAPADRSLKPTYLRWFFTPSILAMFFSITACQEEKETIKPRFQPLTESVYASVTIQPKALYKVYSNTNGVIKEILVAENQLVQKGEKIAQIRNNLPKINLEKAQLNTQLATQNYNQKAILLQGIEDEIQYAQLQVKSDSINYFRQKKIWEQNIGSAAEFDKRKLAFEFSKSKLVSLKNAYQSAQTEINNQLNTQIQLAKSNLSASKISKQDFEIQSNIKGKVYEVFKNAGESITVQEPLATIGNADDFVIEMEIDEVDIARLQVGQKILLNLDAYGQENYEAYISKIFPQKKLRTQTFKVEGIFKNQPTKLYSGLSGEANIIIDQKEKVLTIPLDYLIGNDQVNTAEGILTIKTGVRNMSTIEIIAGIDTSTVILKPE